MKQLSIFKDDEIKIPASKNQVYYDIHHNYFRCSNCNNMLSCSESPWVRYCDSCGIKLIWNAHTKNKKGESCIRKEIIRDSYKEKKI
jgi:predicted RNA-binding Zn-ribbon protein involved in translation (DUF1610 family)